MPGEDPHDRTASLRAASGYAPARTHDPGDPAFAGLPSPELGMTGVSDDCLLAILRIQGFDGLPAPVSEPVLDRLIEQGWRELWRGIADAEDGPSAYEIVHEFASGELTYVGEGFYGSGHYFAADPGDAAGYAGDEGRTIRAALNPDTRLVDIDQIEDDVRIWRTTADTEEARRVMKDGGRFAAASGYDAITIPQRDFVLVLNRTALAVEVADV